MDEDHNDLYDINELEEYLNEPERDEPQPSQSDNPSKTQKRKPSRDASWVWEHFEKIPDCDPNNPRCKCKYCGVDYACDTKRCGTSTLRNHLLNQCKKYPNRTVDKKQQVLSFESGSSNLVSTSTTYSKEACRLACAQMIIIDELPFSHVEGEGFRKFCNALNPKYEQPSRRTISRDVFQLYLDEKKLLKSLFSLRKQRVCLTTDTWTSIQNNNYMTLTAHFIDDDWKLHKRILNFCVVQNHKGETIGKVIEECLSEWGIERVFTITVDNASSNDVAINFVKERLNDWKGSVLDGEFLHVRCAAHIVNLIVTFGLREIHDSIVGIRNAVRYVRSSPSRLSNFKECVEWEKIEFKETVVLDVSTRWNSTYLMLNSALKYQKAFDRMKDVDGFFLRYFEEDEVGRKRAGPPQIKDWESARVFVKFLATFYEVTLKFSASLTVTSNICFHELSLMYNALIEWSNSQNHLMAEMEKKMLTKFEKYWGSLGNVNKLLLIAVVLDPRYKLEYVSYLFEDAYESEMVESLTKDVKDTLFNLYNFYKEVDSMNESSNMSNSNDSQSTQAQQKEIMDSLNDGSIDDRRRFKEAQFKKRKLDKNILEIKNEVDKFLFDPCEDVENEKFDILAWWKNNCTKYRILSQIAKDIYAIPVSTVASESSFSTGGRILDAFRSSLGPKMVEALICSQNWLQSKPMMHDYRVEVPIEDVAYYDSIELG